MGLVRVGTGVETEVGARVETGPEPAAGPGGGAGEGAVVVCGTADRAWGAWGAVGCAARWTVDGGEGATAGRRDSAGVVLGRGARVAADGGAGVTPGRDIPGSGVGGVGGFGAVGGVGGRPVERGGAVARCTTGGAASRGTASEGLAGSGAPRAGRGVLRTGESGPAGAVFGGDSGGTWAEAASTRSTGPRAGAPRPARRGLRWTGVRGTGVEGVVRLRLSGCRTSVGVVDLPVSTVWCASWGTGVGRTGAADG
ncbi:hypothetical protein GCM10010350_43610 [Streptomyces galilaeus]|nr:hypothetical protein GCM10010350_43610 [Streptomyces galilaeus]